MTGSILDRPEVRVELDSATGAWTVGLGDRSYRVREWTWGERRRLVDGHVRDGGFLREAFVTALVDRLVSLLPDEVEVPVLAAATLRVLGVDPRARPILLFAAEALVATSWGWGPAQLDPQPASRIDRHVAAMASTPAEPPGWNRIDVVDE
jgi:hypothetical protein